MSDLDWNIQEDIVEPEQSETEMPAVVFDDVEQGSVEWHRLRVGKITGSKISNMMAAGKGKTKADYRIQLAIERITGMPVQSGYKSKAMMKGNEDEPLAREYYEFINDVDVDQVGFVLHPLLPNSGASPDGLIGNDGLIEIKCPNMETHVGYLLSKKIPCDYMLQMQWQLACTGRLWCDWMTYAKEMPIHLRSLIIRVHRDEKKIRELESTAWQFNEEIEQLIIKLRTLS